jgi:hypothetical protein
LVAGRASGELKAPCTDLLERHAEELGQPDITKPGQRREVVSRRQRHAGVAFRAHLVEGASISSVSTSIA